MSSQAQTLFQLLNRIRSGDHTGPEKGLMVLRTQPFPLGTALRSRKKGILSLHIFCLIHVLIIIMATTILTNQTINLHHF